MKLIQHFLRLEWKSFFRSASFEKNLALKLVMGFIAAYFLLSFLVLGIELYPILEESFPGQKPLIIVNNFVIFWMVMDLVLRFFMQSLPVINIQPLLVLPIKKQKIINFVLIKSLTSVYNIFPLIIIIPFGVTCILKENYTVVSMMAWMLAMYSLALVVNFTNFVIKKKFAENTKMFIVFVFFALVLATLEYSTIFKSSAVIAFVLNTLIEQPILVLVPILLLVGIYFSNFKYLKSNFYLDNSLQTKSKEAATSDLSWIKRFGDIAPFLQLDLKLIWRNKRPRSTIIMSFIFLAYGLLIYNNQHYKDIPSSFVAVGILMTGIFIINFGQFIPSWDSSYYVMMMSQNIPMKKYLASKAGLMSVSVVVLAILTSPYLYFGWKVLAINLACAIYNLGVNIPVILFAGSYNKAKIDLEKSPFMNYQGTGATQWIVGFPLILVPILIFYEVATIFNSETAILVLGLFGIIGLLMRNLLIDKIAEAYRKRKYATIDGFKQQEN